jgi:hypothetical protein
MAINDLGAPSVVNVAFVPLAVEAGIIPTIKSLVGLSLSLPQLVVALHDALIGSNAPLAEAMNFDTVRALLAYMAESGESVVLGSDLPVTLDQAGPASVSAGRDGGTPTQLNIGFSTPPEGFKGAIYLDGVYAKTSTQTGNPTVFDILANVPAGYHTVRVLYKRDSDGAMSRFGQIVTILS